MPANFSEWTIGSDITGIKIGEYQRLPRARARRLLSVIMRAQPEQGSFERCGDEPGINGEKLPDCEQLAIKNQSLSGGNLAFEIHSVSGKLTRGIEIEITGFGPDDVFSAYYLNRHGAPDVTSTGASTRLRFQSLGQAAAQTLSQTCEVNAASATRVSRPFIWEFVLYGGGVNGSDRFCLEMSTHEVIATYRWLVAAEGTEVSLVAESTPAFIHDARTGHSWTCPSMQQAE